MDGSYDFSVWLEHWEKQHQLCVPCCKVHVPKAESMQLQGHDETTHLYHLYHILDVDVPILLGCIHMILTEMTHASNWLWFNPSNFQILWHPGTKSSTPIQVVNMKAVSKLRSYIVRPVHVVHVVHVHFKGLLPVDAFVSEPSMSASKLEQKMTHTPKAYKAPERGMTRRCCHYMM